MPRAKNSADISKLLSLVLRHKPETIGLTLDANGWADTSDLIEKLNTRGLNITFAILEKIVSTNDKQRFSFNGDKTRIRANQGHSISIDLGLPIKEPPPYLYHGTSEKSMNSILLSGLLKGNRQYVHLSNDFETALRVGRRHGTPVVFTVATGLMNIDGYRFYLSANRVWLTDHVPPKYLELPK
jgi:putative RNA 2'-phosphotransferase